MSVQHYHGLCHRYMGRAVEIRTRDGRIHRGVIRRVTGNRVYIQPIGRRRNLGGYGYGYYGYGGWGWYGIGLGFITGLVLGSLFFW